MRTRGTTGMRDRFVSDCRRVVVSQILKLIAVAAVLVLVANMLCGCDSGNGVKRERHDSSTDGRFEYEGYYGTWFGTVTDTETGVVYLVFEKDKGDCSIGGITPLIGNDGGLTYDDRYAK